MSKPLSDARHAMMRAPGCWARVPRGSGGLAQGRPGRGGGRLWRGALGAAVGAGLMWAVVGEAWAQSPTLVSDIAITTHSHDEDEGQKVVLERACVSGEACTRGTGFLSSHLNYLATVSSTIPYIRIAVTRSREGMANFEVDYQGTPPRNLPDGPSGDLRGGSGAPSGIIPLGLGRSRFVVRFRASGAPVAEYVFGITRAAGRPPLPPLHVLLARAGMLTLTWDPPFDNGGAVITGYLVRWATTARPNTYLNENGDTGMDIPDEAAAGRRHAIADLTSGVAYRVQIAAVNSHGVGAWSFDQIGTPRGRPLAVQNFNATAARGNLVLTWDAVEGVGDSAITGYRYRWSDDGDSSDWESAGGEAGVEIADSASATRHLISDLANGKTYKVQIVAVNGLGVGAWSLGVSVGLLVVPSAPRNVALGADGEELFVVWDPPASGGGVPLVALRYEVRWRVGNASTFTASDATTVSAGVTIAQIANLTAATEYAVQVRAVNEAGPSVWAEITGQTRPAGLARASALDVDGVSGASSVDGILIARYLFGLRGDALIAGLNLTIPATAVVARITIGVEGLDVDAVGGVTPADGLLIARYLLGVTSDPSLRSGQTVATEDTVTTNIEALLPPP